MSSSFHSLTKDNNTCPRCGELGRHASRCGSGLRVKRCTLRLKQTDGSCSPCRAVLYQPAATSLQRQTLLDVASLFFTSTYTKLQPNPHCNPDTASNPDRLSIPSRTASRSMRTSGPACGRSWSGSRLLPRQKQLQGQPRRSRSRSL